ATPPHNLNNSGSPSRNSARAPAFFTAAGSHYLSRIATTTDEDCRNFVRPDPELASNGPIRGRAPVGAVRRMRAVAQERTAVVKKQPGRGEPRPDPSPPLP